MAHRTDEPQSGFRVSVAGQGQLNGLITAPLPLGLRETSAATSFHRDLYFDTPDGALHAHDVACRLRYRSDGRCILSLKLPGRNSYDIVEAELDPMDPAEALAAESEPMRRCRAFADPASLCQQAELEIRRTVRQAHTGWLWRERFELSYDDVTVRRGELSRSFQELKVRHQGRGRGLIRLAQTLALTQSLPVSLTTKLERATAILRRLEADEMTLQTGPGRSVVVFAMDGNLVAVVREGGRIRLPSGPGAGEAACRNTLQFWLQSRVGDPFFAGTAETPTGDRSIEVWIVRRVRRSTPSPARATVDWIPAESLEGQVDGGVLTDPESVTAYRLVSPSGLLTVPPPASARAPSASTDREAPDLPSDHLLDAPESELAFILRVLALAEDARVPILERIRYLGIVSSNLDEFYMGSAGALRQGARDRNGADPRVARLSEEVSRLLDRQQAALDDCLALLSSHGFPLRDWESLSELEREPLREIFREEILPLLTPRAITMSPGHPFPVMPPLTLSLVVMLDEGTGPVHYAYLKLPASLPRFLPVAGGFLPVEALVRAELPRVYPERSVGGGWLFRITRLSDLDLDEARAGNLLQAMEEDLERRRRNPLVRVEIERTMPGEVLDTLLRELRLEGRGGSPRTATPEIHRIQGLMALADVRQLAEVVIPAGNFPPFVARDPFARDQTIWEQIRSSDRLVHHPYDDFGSTVGRFIGDAAADTDVTGIKLMLYRAGDRSALVESLEAAARAGKDVTAFVELKARFDEARNVFWVKRLEAAGVQVVYGVVGLKNHAKVALVIRRERDGLRRYVHIGTGNYNAGTARVYTDLGLFSADPALGEDIHDLFNQLTGSSGPPRARFRKILAAPVQLLPEVIARIEREAGHASAGRGGMIRAKINGLAEPEVIEALYRASQAGVEIDLLVRGISLLRPGIPGLSDRIRVRSTLGRFLEHARIYHFGNGDEPEYFIASADWRPRNLKRRIEVATPVSDPVCRAYLDRILTLELNDPTGWTLNPDGSYIPPRAPVGDAGSAQRILQDETVSREPPRSVAP